MTTIKKTTKINKANTNRNSYRTTIPQQVVELLELDITDELEWIIKIKDNKLKVTIQKKEEE